MHGAAAVHPKPKALAVLIYDQFAGVAGCASDVEHALSDLRLEVAGESNRQAVGIDFGGRRVHQEPVGVHALGRGELLLSERNFERHEPGIGQVLDRRALRREVIKLA